MLFDLEADPQESRDVAGVERMRPVLAELMAIARVNYDVRELDAIVRLSQKRRLFMRAVNDRISEKTNWNWISKSGDAFRYVRGWGIDKGEHNTKALSRIPQQ